MGKVNSGHGPEPVVVSGSGKAAEFLKAQEGKPRKTRPRKSEPQTEEGKVKQA